MKLEQEDFQQLRRLLVLKRHEQPPPGYFENLRRQVIARIRAGDQSADSFLDRLYLQVPWSRRVYAAFEAKPVLAGAFAIAVSGLLVAGVIFSDQSEADTAFALVPSSADAGTVATAPAAQPVRSLFGQSLGAESSSTQGVLGIPAGNSLFQDLRQQQRLQMVRFTVPN